MSTNMSTLILPERVIEVGIRWTEVHARKLLDIIGTLNGHLLPIDLNYVYSHHVTIHIDFKPKCIYNDSLVPCKDASCPSTRWFVVITVTLHYDDDILFGLTIEKEEDLKKIRPVFEEWKKEIPVCICGRLGKKQIIESENGKCNNCYTYGFIRGEICSICHMDDGKPWLKTECGHYFHDMCWFHITEINTGIRKCPLCRNIQPNHTLTKL